MGNGQSAPPSSKAANKLSKPRTNSWGKLMGPKFRPRSRFNSEPNILRYSHDTEETTVSEVSGQEDTGRLFRPKSSHGEIVQADINDDVNGDHVESAEILPVSNPQIVVVEEDKPNSPTRGAAPAKRPPARPARLSLQNLQLSPNKRLSFVAETSSAQPSSAKQLRFTGIEEDDKRRQSGPLQRAQSDTNLYSPIRRRSFLQHGIATRNSGIDTDPLRWFRRSSNSRGNAQNGRSNPTSPASNSLTNIAPVTPRLEVDSLCPRAVTPSGSDYGHIGAFKLGSLRITNGAASPAPSDIPTTICGDEDEYVSASEGRPSLESNEDDIARYSWKENSQSTPRQETSNMGILPAGKLTVNAASPKPMSIETHLPLQEFSLFKFTDSPSRPQTPSNQLVSDDAMSPLSLENSPSMSPNFKVQATSKHMAVEDDLFEPEPQSQGRSTFRIHSSFDSAYQDPETPAIKINNPQDHELRLLSKSDSGYSSNMSLRSCTSNPTVISTTQRLPAPSKARISMSNRRTYSSESAKPNGPREPHSRSTSIEGTISKASAVSYLTVRPKRLAPPSLQRSDTGRPSPRQPPPLAFKYSSPPMTRERASRPPSRTSSGQTLREEPNNSASLTSTGIFTVPNPTSRWRSKTKSRQPVFTVRASPTVSEQLNIPPVPKEASRRLEQRTEGYPAARLPDPWAEGASTSTGASSNETLDRVFSDGSTEFGDDLPSVPVNSPIQDASSTASSANRRTTRGVSVPHAGISRESNDYPTRTSSGDETPRFQKQKFSGLGIQGVSYQNNSSQPDVRSERGRTSRREAPPLHSFERSAPRQYHSSEFRPRCPSCGPSPQSNEWYGQRSYSMVSQYPPPRISPGINQSRSPRVTRARQKSLPPLPISMWSQDRIQASHMALHSVIPPVMNMPFPRPEDRMFTEQQGGPDAWGNRKPFWAGRRSSESQGPSRSARPSMDFHRPHRRHMSFDMRPQEMNYDSEAYEPRAQGVWGQEEEGYDNAFADIQWEQQDSYEEPHGTYFYSKENKLPFFSQQEVDCVNSEEEPLYQQLPEAAHWRGTPTANVLEPDSFAGDLANGYESETWNMRPTQPKRRRRSFRDSYAWGVAMNAVPVFLQKVKITKS